MTDELKIVRHLLDDGRLDEALEKLISLLSNQKKRNFKNELNQVLKLNFDFIDLDSSYRMGVVSQDSFLSKKGIIVNKLLQLLSRIENRPSFLRKFLNSLIRYFRGDKISFFVIYVALLALVLISVNSFSPRFQEIFGDIFSENNFGA